MLTKRQCVTTVSLALSAVIAGCSTPLYEFPDVSPGLPPGQTNLITNPSFEDRFAEVCSAACDASSGWSIEHSTEGAPTAAFTADGAVDGDRAVHFEYQGREGDDGEKKFVQIYTNAASPTIRPGARLTFTLWVSGSCAACVPFIGVEAFDEKFTYLGEADQYFDVPKSPRPVQVSYELPPETASVAAYIQVPEIYATSAVDLYLDNAILTSDAE